MPLVKRIEVKESLAELKGLHKRVATHLKPRVQMLVLALQKDLHSKYALATVLGVDKNSIHNWKTAYGQGEGYRYCYRRKEVGTNPPSLMSGRLLPLQTNSGIPMRRRHVPLPICSSGCRSTICRASTITPYVNTSKPNMERRSRWSGKATWEKTGHRWRRLKKVAGDLIGLKEQHSGFLHYNLYCMDESRFGLLTLAHRALAARGVRPLCRFEHRFETTYLYGAFSPLNGAHLVLEMPGCNTENMQAFPHAFSLHHPQEFKILLLDNAAFHKAKALLWPANIRPLFLPPYAPELNPAEKVWWRIKRELKNRLFKTLEDLQEAMTAAVNKITTTPQIKQLCSYAYYQTINLA